MLHFYRIPPRNLERSPCRYLVGLRTCRQESSTASKGRITALGGIPTAFNRRLGSFGTSSIGRRQTLDHPCLDGAPAFLPTSWLILYHQEYLVAVFKWKHVHGITVNAHKVWVAITIHIDDAPVGRPGSLPIVLLA